MALAKYTKVCAKNTPGISWIAIAEKANMTALTLTTGEVSAITGSGAFKPVAFEIDTAEYKEEATGGNSIAWKQTLSFMLDKPVTAMMTFLNALTDAVACGVYAIIKDNNGVYWLIGYNSGDEKARRGLNEIKLTRDSGKKPSEQDKQTVSIELSGEIPCMAIPFDSTQTTALNGGSSPTYVDWS
jgi:hypothetical protein